jgi:hypothetical protein
MGMQSASIQQSPNQGNGKGFAQPTGLRPQGDYGDVAFDRPQPLPARLNMADQLLGGQYTQGPSNNGQWDATEGGGMSGTPNVVPQGDPVFHNTGISGFNQPLGGQNGKPDSYDAPAVMPYKPSPMGKGGSRNITMPGQGGQPRMGQPNAYSNTIQPWDNANIKPQNQSGKGKGY